MSRAKKSDIVIMDYEIIEKESHQRQKQENKAKGLSSEPHPKDRESGNGRGKEMRKNGAGKNNWGNYQDDFKQYEFEDIEVSEDPIDNPAIQTKESIIEKDRPIIIDDLNFPKLI